MLDLPTGAAMVTAFALFLLVAGIAKALVLVVADRRRANLRHAVRTMLGLSLALTLAASLWLIINPAGDQPLAATFESATGFGPERFLSMTERDIYDSAGQDGVRFQNEVDRLDAREKAARVQGIPLSDEEIRRIASYQQSFNEMTRGERFVQDVLRGKARTRARWIIGVPGTLIALLGLLWLTRRSWKHRLRAA